MLEVMALVAMGLLFAVVAMQAALLLRRQPILDLSSVSSRVDLMERVLERSERAAKEEFAKNREEAGGHARGLREEVGATLKGVSDTVVKTLGEIAQGQRAQLEGFSSQLAKLTDANDANARLFREEVTAGLKATTESMLRQISESAKLQKDQLEAFASNLASAGESSEKQLERMREDVVNQLKRLQEESGTRLDRLNEDQTTNARQTREETASALKAFNDSVLQGVTGVANLTRAQLEAFAGQLERLVASSDQKHEALKGMVEQKLSLIQQDSSKKLEDIRQTVDEKLQGTLEKRLGESFRLVSDRLEQVHKGLGEMQTLATGVGDLKRVLTNVKARGTLGEIQLGNLLEQILSPEQYAQNVATKDEGNERVEFAIKLPGREEANEQTVWLPIDSKFPTEDFQRLLDAADSADAVALEQAGRQLETRIKACARDIRDKYLNPPRTTDFGIMFLPFEGLYAEVLRRPGVVELLQREFRVTIAGPTTLAAFLNSLQMGFRTLAIQKRSSEVWSVLGAIKTEFGKFGDVLSKVQTKLSEASNVIDSAAVRTRAINRKLRSVQELPAAEVQRLLGPSDAVTDEALVDPQS